jgi:hypothetical protein
LWEPYISMGPSGTISIEFFTSDDNGNYMIDVQGVSINGAPLHAVAEFKVESEF